MLGLVAFFTNLALASVYRGSYDPCLVSEEIEDQPFGGCMDKEHNDADRYVLLQTTAVLSGRLQHKNVLPLVPSDVTNASETALTMNNTRQESSIKSIMLECVDERDHVILVLSFLFVAVFFVGFANSLWTTGVVNSVNLKPIVASKIPVDSELHILCVGNIVHMADTNGHEMYKITIDSLSSNTGPKELPCQFGRLHNALGKFVATSIVRNTANHDWRISICTPGETYAVVEREIADRDVFQVRHRSGAPLMTVTGDFDEPRISIMDPHGNTLCEIRVVNHSVVGHVQEWIDVGLLFLVVTAIYIQRGSLSPLDQSQNLAKEATEQEEVAPDCEEHKIESAIN